MKNITEPAPPLPLLPPETRLILIDAGMERLRLRFCDATRKVLAKATLPGRPDLQAAAAAWGLGNGAERPELLITGRLRDTVRELLGYGDPILPEAALWSAAAALAKDHPLAVLEVSASGYTAVGVNSSGELHGELLAAPPRCGSGTGINLDRVLQKLGVSRTEVDPLLAEFLGKAGAEHRRAIPLRSDRCGVFASSATVSDKNQGLPVADALAATLKSEVVKACKTIPEGFKTVWLTGGVFAWKFARDCARDYLNGQGVGEIPWDEAGELPLQGLLWLRDRIPPGRLFRPEPALLPPLELGGRPALAAVHRDLAERHLYHRLEPETFPASASIPAGRPLLIGLDVGSTMAKLVVADLNGVPLHCAAHSNAGDTLDTVKALFGELARRGAETLEVAGIGITGSARHQVRQALLHVYPELADRVLVLVENYAHARGSLDLARAHIGRLKEWGIEGIDEEFAIVIDVGGEDTKVSTVLLDEGELFDNVMNGKCSAGTGSLLDAQALHFGLPDCGAGAELAWQAQQGHSLNATCAVFLLESARRLEALGVPRGEILASAEWAVAENMARGLWSRLELPVRAVALLHGQTMLSEALPTAVAARLQEYLGAPAYCLVPPYPGHRACLGLIRTLAEQRLGSSVALPLCRFLDQTYDKRLFQCSGNACGNPEARCRRSRLSAVNPQGKKTELLLGGCAAINERAGRSGATRPDTWRELWEFSAAKLPRSEDPQRLVIPRQFAISEWAPFFAHLFLPLGIPVHVDAIAEQDIIAGRPHFPVDACAPFLGAVGQLLRLAGEPHGTILAPQIEFLPGPGSSLGRACTVNQGGPATAVALARQRHPEARFHLFHLDLKSLDGDRLAHKLHPRLEPVFRRYGRVPDLDTFRGIVARALEAQVAHRRAGADRAAALAAAALAEGKRLALVLGREYVLQPGIFDSHVGRLLRDQGLTGIPGHLIEIDPDPDFGHLYWRNALHIATLTQAASRGELHAKVRHEGLRNVFATVEQQGDEQLALIQVSTFLCGPDSVTNPLLDRLTRRRPLLRLQSDAAIQELAHLENRLNTYLRQLAAGLHSKLKRGNQEGFEIRLLDPLTQTEPLNRETDLICFPTLADNRLLSAVLRGAGFACLENYDDGYDLRHAVAAGRAATGEAVCAPLAAVYGDILQAAARFRALRRERNPAMAGKQRLLIFNNKGLGPCRQGQYVETHKLFFHDREEADANEAEDQALIRFLVAHENQGFRAGFPIGVFMRGLQSVILQGVLHQLLGEGTARCRNLEEYQDFAAAYRKLKVELGEILEHRLAPSPPRRKWGERWSRIPLLGWAIQWWAGRWYARDIPRALSRFARRWCRGPLPQGALRIHIDGEAYMRTAQFEELHRTLLATLGFGRFRLTQAPLWGFLEYKLAGMQMRSEEGIAESRAEIRRAHSEPFRAERRRFLWTKRRRLLQVTAALLLLRKGLAAPLYRAAGLPLPHPMTEVLKAGAEVIPTRRPGGELIPFVGETLLQLRAGCDLVLNVAPEGCMVSTMGQVLAPAIQQAAPNATGRVCPVFSQQGDIDPRQVALALLKALGPQRFYGGGAIAEGETP